MNQSTAMHNIRRIMLLIATVGMIASTTAPADELSRRPEGPAKPLKVFILAGQSNMQGHAHIRTLDALALDPKTAPFLEAIVDDAGQPRVCDDVWISSLGSAPQEKTGQLTVGFGAGGNGEKIGPELTFGVFMQKHLNEPILIIKTAWGGKSLHTDFRPPGAGPYRFSEPELNAMARQGKDVEAEQAAKAQATGHYYRLMMSHVKQVLADIERVYPDYDAERGYELAGFVWFQGWNDMVDGGAYPNRDKPGGYDGYSALLAQFIRDVRDELDAPKLPFVIGVMGVGGPTDQYGPDQQRYKDVHQRFRDAMAAPAGLREFRGNVAAVRTETCWDMEVVALRAREHELKPQREAIEKQVEDGRVTRAQGDAALKRLDAQAFSQRELKLLRESTSNADYHYMGSARIMTQIGKAFADAMAELMQELPSTKTRGTAR